MLHLQISSWFTKPSSRVHSRSSCAIAKMRGWALLHLRLTLGFVMQALTLQLLVFLPSDLWLDLVQPVSCQSLPLPVPVRTVRHEPLWCEPDIVQSAGSLPIGRPPFTLLRMSADRGDYRDLLAIKQPDHVHLTFSAFLTSAFAAVTICPWHILCTYLACPLHTPC